MLQILIYCILALPQQLPGPAHPAFVGVEPQQDVSPGPGNFEELEPDIDECAESIFLRFSLPHPAHRGLSVEDEIRTSLTSPHSTHKKSKRGITLFS
jgi:hypothetical protein